MDEDIRVLVVDEDDDVLELTETFLERESDAITVTTEQSVSTAVDRLENEAVDCVVSDYRMPEMNGLEFYEATREHASSIPFFLFSAAVDQEVVERAEAAGVTKFIQKGAGTDHYRDMAEQIESAVRSD